MDVTVALQPDEPKRFAASMRRAGFALRVADLDDFLERTRVIPFVHADSAMPLDVVLAGSGLEDEFLGRAERIELGGARIPFLRPEDLLVTKALAGRPKDIDDAGALLRAHRGRLDIGRVRRLLAELEEALGQSDLVSAFDALVSATTA